MNGVPPAVISNYLERGDVKMTIRRAHLSPDNDERKPQRCGSTKRKPAPALVRGAKTIEDVLWRIPI
jgi:hypothetical protein